MILTSLKRWFIGTRSKPVRRASFRPEILVLEERVTPASRVWVGAADGNWSVAANWNGGVAPTAGDTVIFDATPGFGSNTNSAMNIGGDDGFHIGALVISHYTGTITLSSHLYVDELSMRSAATITGNKSLLIMQRTNTGAGGNVSAAIGASTIFAGSTWTAGTIGTDNFYLRGETTHPATLQIGQPNTAVTLRTTFTISDEFSTVNWTFGNIFVPAPGNLGTQGVSNNGMFNAASSGSMGNNVVGNGWAFDNRAGATLVQRAPNQFPNATVRNFRFGRVIVGILAFGETPRTSEIVGAFAQDDGDAITSVESGTLLVTGTFSQTKGNVTIMGDASLTVTSDFTESANANFNIQLTTPQSGSGLLKVGGTVTLAGSTLNVTALPGFSGNQFTLIRNTGGVSVVGYFAGLPEGATLPVGGRTFRITYMGNLTNDVVLNWVNQPPTGANNTLNTSVGTPYTFSTADFGFSDPDGNNFFAVQITTLPTNGTLTYLGLPVYAGQFVRASDIAAGRLVYTPPGVAGSYTFTFQVQDDGGTGYGGIDLDPIARIMTINVT